MTIQPINPNLPQVWAKRPDGVTVTAIYHYGIAVLFLLGTVIMAVPAFILGIIALAEEADMVIPTVVLGLIAVVLMVMCLIYLAVGYGLWKLQQWARVAAIALAILSLLAVPIGTILGAITLWYLLQPEIAARFETQP
jgi:uncharacterized membrane protein (DUF2068 family)